MKERIIIAGPCSAETGQQVMAAARQLAAVGIRIFRCGLWKPRTKPGSFEGVGEKGFKWLEEVRRETGMSLATEVAVPAHVDAAMAHGIEYLWIGARTTSNPFAVQQIAEAIGRHVNAGKRVNVMVKNPISPDLDLWEGAIMRITQAGVKECWAVHRGFSAYGEKELRNRPYWRLAMELKRRQKDIKLICDPSHMAGRRELIEELSQRALSMGYDGLMIESHCDPANAWSDSRQQLTPESLGKLLKRLEWRIGKEEIASEGQKLERLRKQIDELDIELLDLLSKRMEISRTIGEYKKRCGVAVLQPERYEDIMNQRLRTGAESGLSERFVQHIMSAIHEESVRVQVEVDGEE